MKCVPYEGPKNARIVICGEAPGADEVRHGRPFCGGAGRVLDALLADAGILREDCRIANVCRYRPPANKFEALSPELVAIETEYLKEDIKRTNPNVVVALGVHALKALTGKSFIHNWRGSVIMAKDLGVKVLPTIHPAALMRQWKDAPLVLFDLKKAKEEAKTDRRRVPSRDLIVRPTFDLVMSELGRLSKADRLAFDIETFTKDREMVISAISFADAPHSAISIPFTEREDNRGYWTPKQRQDIISLLYTILEDSRIDKLAHNSQFDCGVLKHVWDIDVDGLILDTMCAFHVVYPELPKSLATVQSIYTNTPYYNDWTAWGDEWFWKYNAMDSAICFEVAGCIEKEMKEFGVWDFYYQHIHPLLPVLLDMQLRGVKINEPLRDKATAEYQEKLDRLTTEFVTHFVPEGFVCGKEGRRRQHIVDKLADLESSGKWAKKDGEPTKNYLRWKEKLGEFEATFNPASPEQLKELLNSMGAGVKSADEPVLTKLARQTKFTPLVKHLLEMRKTAKVLGTYLKAPLRNGRIHTSYNIGGRLENEEGTKVISGPETGRLSSSRSIILGAGTNLQNIPSGICRELFIPDPGKIMVEVDLCVGGQTRILKTDLTWATANTIQPGDELIAFDENLSRGVCKYKATTVTDNTPLVKKCVNLYTDKGSVICSLEHMWVTRKPKRSRKWAKTCDLVVGDQIAWMGYPWEPEYTYGAGWLAGLFDGEGHFCDTSIGFTQKEGKGVWERGIIELKNRGFFPATDRNASGIPRANLHGKQTWRFLGQIRPTRMLENCRTVWEGRCISGRREQKATVLGIHYIGEQKVYPVSTTSKTFIAEGLLSHNSQAEARVVAYLAAEPKMIQLFEEGGDIHRLNASFIYDKPVEDVTKDERQMAKRHVHAFNYGESAQGFAKSAEIPLHEAKRIRAKYFSHLPRLASWQMSVVSELRKNRVMVTPFGRKRHFFGRWNHDLHKEAFAYVPQSTVGDILNVALVRIGGILQEHNMDAQLLLQVHDSFVLQCSHKDLQLLLQLLPKVFEIPVVLGRRTFVVPYEVKVGECWGRMEEVTND